MTTKTTHTPGPWRVGVINHMVFGPPNVTSGPEIITSSIRKKSDSHLIAAAPDLLAALETLVDKGKPWGGYSPDELEIATKAIAKAKGEGN